MEGGTVEIGSDFAARLADLRNDPDTTDFTIICGADTYKVHKLILGLHSEYFARLFKSDFQENRESRITLAEDLCRPVRCMIGYLYGFDYIFVFEDFHRPGTPHEEESLGRPPDAGQNQGLSSELHAHACMYTLAEKYDIAGLKTLAKAKFESRAEFALNVTIGWNEEGDDELELAKRLLSPYANEFLDVISYVYENTAPNEMGLRDSIVKAWSAGAVKVKNLVKRKKWTELMEKYPELGVDMVVGLGAGDTNEDENSEAESSSGESFFAESE